MTGKMLPCSACMGSQGRARHERDVIDWGADPIVWAWRCSNCGHVKKPRAQQKRTSYDYVTKEAESDKGLSIPNRAKFHYFNPNGAKANKAKLDEAIWDLVNNHGVKSGALIAYGSGNDYAENLLYDVVKKPTYRGLAVALSMLDHAIQSGNKFVAEKRAELGLTPLA